MQKKSSGRELAPQPLWQSDFSATETQYRMHDTHGTRTVFTLQSTVAGCFVRTDEAPRMGHTISPAAFAEGDAEADSVELHFPKDTAWGK